MLRPITIIRKRRPRSRQEKISYCYYRTGSALVLRAITSRDPFTGCMRVRSILVGHHLCKCLRHGWHGDGENCRCCATWRMTASVLTELQLKAVDDDRTGTPDISAALSLLQQLWPTCVPLEPFAQLDVVSKRAAAQRFRVVIERTAMLLEDQGFLSTSWNK